MTTNTENITLLAVHEDIHDAHALLWTLQCMIASATSDTITLPAYGLHQLVSSIRTKTERATNNLTDYLQANGEG
jgi:hypothetical protein